jgi:hypothetical protein
MLRLALCFLARRLAGACPAKVMAFFVVLYEAIWLPVIGLGMTVHQVGIGHATLIFAGLSIALALSVLILLLRAQARGVGKVGVAKS